MRIVFLGSGVFSIPSFEALLGRGHTIAALVTQPDREKGRGRAVAPPPLKPLAEARGIPVLQPRRIREAVEPLKALSPEVQVVVAYGQILPRSVLDIPPRGTVNVHASLLPRYRGAAPIQWALVRGEEETGVTTMLLDEGLDTGPILLQEKTPIGPEETAGVLQDRLARLGAGVLLETLGRLESGTLAPTPQDPALATLAPPLRKEDGILRWDETAASLARRVRGLNPWPGAATRFEGRALKILRARAGAGSDAAPGTVTGIEEEGIRVACREGTLLLLEVQPESRNAMRASDFARGVRLSPGARLDPTT
jgi:methionyl-tRNA formyltransferase